MSENGLAQHEKATPPAFTPAPGGLLQRKCACGGSPGIAGQCEECSNKQLNVQRRAAHQAEPSTVPPIVHDVLRSPGQPLDADTRAFMEPRFEHDFSHVRVHTDGRAAESARTVNALAYTVGGDVVFADRLYAPANDSGRRLLAHELAHVVQQRQISQGGQADLTVGHAIAADELHADRIAESVVSIDPGKTAVTPVSARGTSPMEVGLRRRADRKDESADGRPGCKIGAGIPNTNCSAYAKNSWWLPVAYVQNATCACEETPNVATANCVRKSLQVRLAATPKEIKAEAAKQKTNDNPADAMAYEKYQAFVQRTLTPRIHADHVAAYHECCCSSGPAPYEAWVGVTSVPLPCFAVGASIKMFGSCHGKFFEW